VLTHVTFVGLQVGTTGVYINRKNAGFRRGIINGTTTCQCGRIVTWLVLLAKVACAVNDKVCPHCYCSLYTNRSFCGYARDTKTAERLCEPLLPSIASVPSHSATGVRLNALLWLGIVKPSTFMETHKSEYELKPKARVVWTLLFLQAYPTTACLKS